MGLYRQEWILRFLPIMMYTVLILAFAAGIQFASGDLSQSANHTDVRRHCGECLCSKTYVDCSNRSLTKVPVDELPKDAETLDLTHNMIQGWSDGVFSRFRSLKYLLLSGNKLRSLRSEMFLGLQNLYSLELAWNFLALTDETYPPGVFRHLSASLVLLRLEGNCHVGKGNCETDGTNVTLTYPDTALSDLVKLESLYIDGLPDVIFGPGFGNMTKLHSLHLLGFTEGYCGINNLTYATFVHLPKSLRLLNMSDCNITSIDDDAFTPLDSLITLDISYNKDLGFDRLAHAMFGLQGSRLQHLHIDSLVHRYTMSVLITQQHTRYFKNTSIVSISAQYNRIEAFCEGALDNMPDTLQYVNLFANLLSFGRYFKDLNKLKSLTKLTVDGRYWPSPPPYAYPPTVPSACKKTTGVEDGGCGNGWTREMDALEAWRPDFMKDTRDLASINPQNTRNITFVLPPNLTEFKSRCTQLYYQLLEIDVDPNNSLKTLDLSRNLLAVWIGPIRGLNLTSLNLGNNFAHNVSYSFFKTLASLTYFNASFNDLRQVIYGDENGTLFEPLVNLKVLDLSWNFINTVPENIFKGLVSLKRLYLNRNEIVHFSVDMSHMDNITILDLSYNQIHFLPENTMHHLDNIASVTNKSVYVVIIYNPIACTCQHIDFLTWVEDSRVLFNKSRHYYCLTSDGRDSEPMDNFFSMIDELKRTCADLSGILVGAVSCFFCLMVALTSALVYRFRWKLRYLYYASRINYRRLHTEDDSFLYDAFVSYASEDNDFVHGELVDRLEGRAGLRLNVHNRDWTPGRPIPSNIVAAVQSSRRTLVVLTRHLLESEWCHYEMQVQKYT